MRFTPGFLPWSAIACFLTFLSLATPVALSQDRHRRIRGRAYRNHGAVLPYACRSRIDVRGGGPRTINTEGLRLAYERPSTGVNAIVLSGGSSYGRLVATGKLKGNARSNRVRSKKNSEQPQKSSGCLSRENDTMLTTVTMKRIDEASAFNRAQHAPSSGKWKTLEAPRESAWLDTE